VDRYEEDLICLHCGLTICASIPRFISVCDYLRGTQCARCGSKALAVNLPAKVKREATR
jgi:hypothetical protein